VVLLNLTRRKAYSLMSIHEHLPPEVKRELKQVGWSKGWNWRNWRDAAQARTSIVQPGCTRHERCRKRNFGRRLKKS
jgi:hypothetical protein